jgi:predicted peptidase
MDRRDFCLTLTAGLLLPRLSLSAQDTPFGAHIFTNPRRESLPYRLFTPSRYDKQKQYPLVLWLHGGAGRGTDNLKQISGGNTIGSHVWISAANQAKQSCFVVAPQCPEGDMWTSIDSVKPLRPLELTMELLQEISQTFSIDRKRIYVTGQSMGGFGTWALISQEQNRFAAAIPLCGGGDEAAAPRLVATAVWAFHGAQDQAVSVARSRKMIEAIKRAGGKPRYTEYADLGHVIWERVFAEAELLPWVFAQKLTVKNHS